MCDCCGEIGGLSTPFNNSFNTNGVGDINWDNTTMIGSGDRFDMTFGGWYNNQTTKKKQATRNSEFNQFKSQGSKTSGGYDFSQRPLYVPIKK